MFWCEIFNIFSYEDKDIGGIFKSPLMYVFNFWLLVKNRVCWSTGGGGGAQKHLFDKEAPPSTNFSYPKKWIQLFKPKKIEWPTIQLPKNGMTQDANLESMGPKD